MGSHRHHPPGCRAPQISRRPLRVRRRHLTAVNLLGRSHPSILLRVQDVPLVQPSPFGGASLLDACHRIVTGIDPANRLEHVPSIPDDVPTMGLGAGCGTAAVYCGGRLWTAVVSPSPVETVPDRSSLIGLGLAVTQASAALFRISLRMPFSSTRPSRSGPWTEPTNRAGRPTSPLSTSARSGSWVPALSGRVSRGGSTSSVYKDLGSSSTTTLSRRSTSTAASPSSRPTPGSSAAPWP